jgi:hypothetical protein
MDLRRDAVARVTEWQALTSLHPPQGFGGLQPGSSPPA